MQHHKVNTPYLNFIFHEKYQIKITPSAFHQTQKILLSSKLKEKRRYTHEGGLVTEEERLVSEHVAEHLEVVAAELEHLLSRVDTHALGLHLPRALEPIQLILTTNDQLASFSTGLTHVSDKCRSSVDRRLALSFLPLSFFLFLVYNLTSQRGRVKNTRMSVNDLLKD